MFQPFLLHGWLHAPSCLLVVLLSLYNFSGTFDLLIADYKFLCHWFQGHVACRFYSFEGLFNWSFFLFICSWFTQPSWALSLNWYFCHFYCNECNSFKTGLPVSMQKLMYKGNLFPKICQCHLYQCLVTFSQIVKYFKRRTTLRAVGFSYAKQERNHCKQPFIPLNWPLSSTMDE